MGHRHFKRDASGKGDASQYSDDEWDAPRLSVALLEAPVGTCKESRTSLENENRDPVTGRTLDADLNKLLTHVQERLFSGLNEAWLSPQGYDAWPDFAKLKDGATNEKDATIKATLEAKCKKALEVDAPELLAALNEPEEQWARAVVERFVFSAYGGPGVNQHPEAADTPMFNVWPGASPLLVACQQLCSYCIMSRGVPLEAIGSGVDCIADTVDHTAFKQGFHDKFACGTKYTRLEDLANLDGQKKLTPGSVVVFNPGGPTCRTKDKGKTTHIAAVLRVSGTDVQFFDTGVVVGDGESSGETGTVDHAFSRHGGTISKPESLVAVGALPPKDGAALAEQAKKIALGRPLGFKRLVILDTTNDRAPVRFVSKLLHARFPVSQLVWSLRGLPVKGLAVLWYVYASQRGWTRNLLAEGTPPRPPSEVLKDSGSMLLVNVLRGHDNRKVTVYRRKVAMENGKLVNAWYRDFSLNTGTSTSMPDMGLAMNLKLPDGKEARLEDWCQSPKNIGVHFIHNANDARGIVDDKSAGVFDS